MGSKYSEDLAEAIGRPNHQKLALFVGCNGGDKASRFVTSLPPGLRARVVLVARWDSLEELSAGLKAGAGDFVMSPLTPQSVAGAIDRIAVPVASDRHTSGLPMLTDKQARYGYGQQLLSLREKRNSSIIQRAAMARLSVRGYDRVGILPSGEVGVATYCERARVEEVRRRLEFLLGPTSEVAVASTTEDVVRVPEIPQGLLLASAGGAHRAVASGFAGLPDPGPRKEGEPRILYIEDTLYSLRLVEDAFEMVGGMQLVTATSGGGGLNQARGDAPDLILLDLHLPDMHGEEVLAELKADAATRGIPVLILSADATQASMTRLLAAGAAGYITKPVNLRALIDAIKTNLAA
ncbi:MAG: response regulator [Dehalococcoidia bacterium]